MASKPVSFIGQIPVFPFIERTPDDLRPEPTKDLFVAYDGAGVAHFCIWGDGAFWHYKNNETNDLEVVLNVECWFRVPEIMEIAEGRERNERL